MFPTYSIKDFLISSDQEFQFYVDRFENVKEPPNMMSPHKHDFYEILWVRKGKAIHTIDYHEIKIEPDMLFFMSPGQVHLIDNSKSVEADCIFFTEEFFHLHFPNKDALLELSFLDDSYTNPYLKIDNQVKGSLEPVLHLLQDEFARPDRTRNVISSLLFVFLERIQRAFVEQNKKNYKPLQVVTYNKFKLLVNKDYRNQRPVAFYASELFITPHHLNEVVKQVAGKTASELIRDRLMLEAKRLLVHSQFSIGQIADNLGFKDFSYFSRQFKKYSKLTPDQYRSRMYEKYQFR
jgi:AraC family transcriptional activator of pobA